jgi:hypothetical protein
LDVVASRHGRVVPLTHCLLLWREREGREHQASLETTEHSAESLHLFLDFALASMLVVFQTLPGQDETTALIGSDRPDVDCGVPEGDS